MKKLCFFNKEKCTYEPVKPKEYLIGLGTLALVFGLGWASNTKVISKIFYGKNDTIQIPTIKFSEQALIETLMDCNIKYPHIVLAQAKLESGNFTSKVFKQNHNMFGMKKAKRRITSSQEGNNSYAFYRDWVDCVYDYGMWSQNMLCNVSSESEYFNKLQERYAEDSMYVSKLKTIIEKEKLKALFEE